MKNVIKKIAAMAMAFTLLGTGTAVSKAINPKTNNTLVASAAEELCKNVGNKKYKVVAKHGVNIRKTASANSAKIGSLAYGKTFTVIDEKTTYSTRKFPSFSFSIPDEQWGKVYVKGGGYGWIKLYDIIYDTNVNCVGVNPPFNK